MAFAEDSFKLACSDSEEPMVQVLPAIGGKFFQEHSPVKQRRCPDWWQHDTRTRDGTPTTGSPTSKFNDDLAWDDEEWYALADRMTPRAARMLQLSGSEALPVYLEPGPYSKQTILDDLVSEADGEDASITEKLVEMVDQLLASQTAQQKLVKKLLAKRMASEVLAADVSPAKRGRTLEGRKKSSSYKTAYRVGDDAQVLRTDRTWSPCHVTEIKKDGSVVVVIDIVPQVQKTILSSKLHKHMRPVEHDATDPEELSDLTDDARFRSVSVARSIIDFGGDLSDNESLSADIPDSEASWPMSRTEKRKRIQKLDSQMAAKDHKQLSKEVSTLRKEVEDKKSKKDKSFKA